MRPISRAGLVAISAGLLTMSIALPVSAGSAGPAAAYRPDGLISIVCTRVPEWRNCDPAWVGDGIYNSTARNQKRVWTDYLTYSAERDPRVVVFKIRIQNDGSALDSFRVDADGETAGYVVKFLRKSTNITAALEAGTYSTPVLAPGATFVIKAKVVMPCPSLDDCGRDRAFDVAKRLVTVSSFGAPSVRDAVKFVREPWVCTC